MALTLHNVTILIRGRKLFHPVSFTVEPGQVLTIMGASGIGKSSLIDAISGQLHKDFMMEGQVLLEGKDITVLPPQKRRIGVLYQDALLFPHMSVGANIAFGLSADVKGRSERRALIETTLKDAGLEGFFDRDPASLSGGQQARVALLRTLMSKPGALCLDEPFAKLDPKTREEIRKFVLHFIGHYQIPTILVSHDQNDAWENCLELKNANLD